MQKNIIFEDEHIIVVYKPPGIATQTARLGQQDMVSELKNYFSRNPEYKGKGEPYLGLVHRLDQPVSGILVFGKTKPAAAHLSGQLSSDKMQKYYYAVVLGEPEQESGRLENYLYKDGKANQSMVVREGFPEAKKAILEYKLIKSLMVLDENSEVKGSQRLKNSNEVSLLEIKLLTGRHHQIRVQMSHADMPLLGDGRYGTDKSKQLSQQAGCKNTALCAYKLAFIHPITGKEMMFERQPEGEIFLPFFTKGI